MNCNINILMNINILEVVGIFSWGSVENLRGKLFQKERIPSVMNKKSFLIIFEFIAGEIFLSEPNPKLHI